MSTDQTTTDPATTLLAITTDSEGRTWLRDLGTGDRICLSSGADDVDRLSMVTGMLVDTLNDADPATDYHLEEYETDSEDSDDD